ncbi:MAG: glutamine-synthetase adenylyltransferase [Roseobacter sp.]
MLRRKVQRAMTHSFTPIRVLRPFDPSRGADISKLVSGARPEHQALIAGAAGCSPYLAALVEKETHWLVDALNDVEAAVEATLAEAADWRAPDLNKVLRQAKRRIALMTALADLGGVWPLERVTATLSKFAQVACSAALQQAIAVQIRREKLPGLSEEAIERAGGMVVLAMGKLGAHELNYSSDIDLICLFDETQFEPDAYHDARAGFIRATRAMCASLSEITADGYVFRTDLRLRPDPSVTPVCMAMEAAERYYESLGRTWERAAFIKARAIAGDLGAGQRFLDTLRPFVWRKHLDFASIEDAHNMRLAIREHKGLGGPITLPGHNMKLGRGGIREIEFFTQTRQIIAGGRDPDLRLRGTKESLGVLTERGWVDAETAEVLAENYTFHRTVEHRLQMVQDAQTHSLPGTEAGFERLAAMMDRDVSALKSELLDRLATVHRLTEGFFAPTGSSQPGTDPKDPEIVARWQTYPAFRSERSKALFSRLQPEILRRLSAAGNPEAALLAFDGFLSRLPAGVQLFSLLETNKSLLDLLVDIVSTSPALAQHLSRNAAVLDAVIGGDFFTKWPGQEGLEALLWAQVSRAEDYEAQLNAARRWTKEWHFRIGVHLLRGLIRPVEAAAQYTDLARANVAVLLPVVEDMFAVKHGTPPGLGAVVVGMGSLGAGTLNAASDLDLIVVYDAQGEEASTGEKALATRPYYAKLTQSLITAISAPTAEGKLYEVDMRLRPSGNQGPVATSVAAFESYQQQQAWLWEHLALTRARPVAGPPLLRSRIEAFRGHLLSAPREKTSVLQELAKVRARIRDAKTPRSLWEVKTGPGRLQDIELLAQAGTLMQGDTGRQTDAGLRAAAAQGILSPETLELLLGAAAFYLSVNLAVRLLTNDTLETTALNVASESYLARCLEMDNTDAIETRLETSYAACAEKIDALLRPFE